MVYIVEAPSTPSTTKSRTTATPTNRTTIPATSAAIITRKVIVNSMVILQLVDELAYSLSIVNV
jgi:hypothetical protein